MDTFLQEDCLKLHMQYATGCGVEKNVDQAIYWLKKAYLNSNDADKRVRSFVQTELKNTLKQHRKKKLRHIDYMGIYKGIVLNLFDEYCIQEISSSHVAVHSRAEIIDLWPAIKVGDNVQIRYERGIVAGFKMLN